MLESTLLRGPISWRSPRTIKCLWKGDATSFPPDVAQTTGSMGGSQLDPEESREKKELKNWSNLACYPQTTHQQLIYVTAGTVSSAKWSSEWTRRNRTSQVRPKMRKRRQRYENSEESKSEGRKADQRTNISSINSSAETPCGGSQKARRIDQLTFVK